jgi:cellobiose transport system substrate-binding protein
MNRQKRIKFIVSVLVLILSSFSLFANGESEQKEEKRELLVWQFRGCNLENQITEWGETNDVKIDLQVIDRNTMMANLTTVLASGSGIPDVVVIGGPFIEKFKKNPQHFKNFYDLGAKDIEGDYLSWRLNQLKNEDGTFLMGLPTDVGPVALAYRVDIFEQAGLPTDRDELRELIQDSSDLLKIGKIIKDKTGIPLFNNLDAVFQSLLGQNQKYFFDENGELILTSSEDVKEAWDFCIDAHNAGLSANYKLWSSEWGAGLNNGDFAAQLLPSWMAGSVKGNAPDASGLWDLVTLPQSSNWGGSMISIPAKTKSPKLSYELVSWVLSPEQQLETFKTGGQFPTTVANYSNDELLNYKDPYFNNAPFGKIFSESAENIQAAYIGPDYEMIVQTLLDALSRVEDGSEQPQESFDNAVLEAQRLLDR